MKLPEIIPMPKFMAKAKPINFLIEFPGKNNTHVHLALYMDGWIKRKTRCHCTTNNLMRHGCKCGVK